MKRVHIFFPEQLLSRMRALSLATGISLAEHVRNAVAEYLKRQK